MINWDLKLFYFLNGLAKRWRWLDYFGIFCAVYLIWLIGAAALAIFWFNPAGVFGPASQGAALWRKIFRGQFFKEELLRFKYLFCLLASSGLAYLINFLIGLAFVRTRPFGGIDGVHQLISTSFLHKSFPSSHATIAFALAFSVFFFNRTWGVPLLVAAFLVSWGRVYVGVHYPLDVLVGAILGGVASYVVYRIII